MLDAKSWKNVGERKENRVKNIEQATAQEVLGPDRPAPIFKNTEADFPQKKKSSCVKLVKRGKKRGKGGNEPLSHDLKEGSHDRKEIDSKNNQQQQRSGRENAQFGKARQKNPFLKQNTVLSGRRPFCK